MRDEMNDELIERVAETLREPVRVSPAVDARVMAAVRAIAAGAPGPVAPEADLLVGSPTPRELTIVARSERAIRERELREREARARATRRSGALGLLTSPR